MTGRNESLTLAPGFTVTEADTVLDVGCGSGETCVRVHRVGASVIALDVDESNVRHTRSQVLARRTRSFSAIRSDGHNIPLRDCCVSAVVLQEVLEHVDDPRELLAEAVRVGTANARYLIAVPDPISEDLIALVADPSYFQYPNHIHVFDRAEIESMITDTGLDIISRSTAGFPAALWWLFNIASSPVPVKDWPSGRGKPVGERAETLPAQLWEKTWYEFYKCGGSDIVEPILNHLIPKSQIYAAKKRNSSSRSLNAEISRSPDLGIEIDRLRRENDLLRASRDALRKRLIKVMQSRSWRYTEPLRRLKTALRDILGAMNP